MTPRTITDQSRNRWLICSTESHWSDYCWFTFVSHRTLLSSHICRILKTRSEKLIGRISGGAQYLASIDLLIFIRFFSCDNFILIRGLYYLISNEASISKEASRFIYWACVLDMALNISVLSFTESLLQNVKEKGILTSLVVNLQYWLSLVYPLTFENIPVFLIAYLN